MSDEVKKELTRSMLYWHSEGLLNKGDMVCVRSANLIDFFLVVCSYARTSFVAGPLINYTKGPSFKKPNNLKVLPSTLNLTNKLKLIISTPLFIFDILFGQSSKIIKNVDISASVGLSGYGTLIGIVRTFLTKKNHAFIVRGDRLETVRGSSRKPFNKSFALLRITIYRNIMLSLTKSGRAEIWFQGRGHHAKLLEKLPKQCAHRLKVLDAVLRDLESPLKTEKDTDLVFLGRLTKEKGLLELIEALALLSLEGHKVSLRVIGTGPDETLIKNTAKKLGVLSQIEFAGFISSTSEINHLLASARLFVLPSYTEGLPRSLLEAMWIGTPCISTPVGGIPFLFEDKKSIFFVEPKSADKLKQGISYALEKIDTVQTASMIKNAKKIALNCTFEARAQYFIKEACKS